MIQLMKDASQQFTGERMDGPGFYDRFFDAILTAQEKVGMLPPGYTCINHNNKKKTKLGSCMCHEWEEE